MISTKEGFYDFVQAIMENPYRKGINKTELRNMAGFSSGTLARMGKNQYIELKHIDKICQVLNCEISDVIEVDKSSGTE